MIISYKYPQTLKKDFIQNGLCFGKATPNDEEFLNDMRLCIWFNDERLENIVRIPDHTDPPFRASWPTFIGIIE